MDNINIKITEIQKEISLLPENKLDEIRFYIESLLDKLNIHKPESVNLEGLWKGVGFESIENLDEEIRAIRKELSNSIADKKI